MCLSDVFYVFVFMFGKSLIKFAFYFGISYRRSVLIVFFVVCVLCDCFVCCSILLLKFCIFSDMWFIFVVRNVFNFFSSNVFGFIFAFISAFVVSSNVFCRFFRIVLILFVGINDGVLLLKNIVFSGVFVLSVLFVCIARVVVAIFVRVVASYRCIVVLMFGCVLFVCLMIEIVKL